MSLSVHPDLEAKIRAHADAEGLSIDAYLERLVDRGEAVDEVDESAAIAEVEALVLEAIESGEAFEPGPDYWEAKRSRLNQVLKHPSAH